jgi:hypothetical protein
MMLRFEVSERDRPALPPLDIAGDTVVIGSAALARIRLPAEVARPEHVRIDGRSWTLLAAATVDGEHRAAGDRGALGDATVIEIGTCRVRISAAPADAAATPPRRTESLARELVRSLLGDDAAPSLEIERGPHAGARRSLPPPEAALVIGRGDEASWILLDEDLSRTHAEIRRGWDGVTVVDLGSKNGTRVDGKKVGREPALLRDGAAVTLGGIAMRFRDPAERHLRGEPPARGPSSRVGSAVSPPEPVSSAWPMVVYAAIAGLALAALVWILAS